jgi:hypothetical protein
LRAAIKFLQDDIFHRRKINTIRQKKNFFIPKQRLILQKFVYVKGLVSFKNERRQGGG